MLVAVLPPLLPLLSKAVPQRIWGPSQPNIESALSAFASKNDIPGLCFTISFEDHPLYAYCRGWADREKSTPFTPDTKCALGSISKIPTALAVLRLLREKGIALDTPALRFLKIDDPTARTQIATGLYRRVTFRHLLQHSAAFGTAFNPWSRSAVARAFNAKGPSTARMNVAYELRKPLPYAPGEKFEYSNFGYLLLGRLIEDISGRRYADYVQSSVFAPIGVRGWTIRHSREEEQAPLESHYYEEPARRYSSVFAADGEKRVPMMYGGAAYEEADSCGGWLADSLSLANLASSFASSRMNRIVSTSDMWQMVARPDYVGSSNQYKGLGPDIERSVDGRLFCFRHGGIVPGAVSWFSSNFAGVVMTLVMNKGIEGRELNWEIHQPMMDAVCAKDWHGYSDITGYLSSHG